jgi:hypothetical protein
VVSPRYFFQIEVILCLRMSPADLAAKPAAAGCNSERALRVKSWHNPAGTTAVEDEYDFTAPYEGEAAGEHLRPATRVQFRQSAVLQNSITPSLRAQGFEDEDDDENEDDFDAPCGALGFPEMLLQPNSIGFLQPGQDFIIQLVNGFYQEMMDVISGGNGFNFCEPRRFKSSS